jgi:uridine phosphorylase
VSVTSAGQIDAIAEPPYFVLIERAWRDEGTSLHYLPPSEWSHMRAELAALLEGAFADLDEPVISGASWTTDAPLRETATAIAAARAAGIHAVEMEAAALYACATPRVATPQVKTFAAIALVRSERARGNSQFYVEPYEVNA